jgi:hypothetical protein
MSYPTPLTPSATETLMQAATITALGIAYQQDPPLVNDPAYGLVRIGWQQQGEPRWKIGDDVAILRAVEEDDPINRTRDEQYIDSGNQNEDDVELTTYIRVWRVFWVLYGPNSFDNARKLRSALHRFPVHDQLAALNLYWVTDAGAPRRVPEQSAGQWWERVDFEARFNEGAYESVLVGTVNNVEVFVEKADVIVEGG